MKRSHLFALLVTLATVVVAQETNEECRKMPEGNPKECCTTPKKDKEKIHQCLSTLREEKSRCWSDCIFSDAEVFVDGDINRDNLLTAIRQHFDGATSFDDVHEPAADHCIAERTKIMEKFGEKMRDSKCDHTKGGFAMCLQRYYFNNCPDDAWNESDTCNAWKNFSKNCQFFGRRKPKD